MECWRCWRSQTSGQKTGGWRAFWPARISVSSHSGRHGNGHRSDHYPVQGIRCPPLYPPITPHGTIRLEWRALLSADCPDNRVIQNFETIPFIRDIPVQSISKVGTNTELIVILRAEIASPIPRAPLCRRSTTDLNLLRMYTRCISPLHAVYSRSHRRTL